MNDNLAIYSNKIIAALSEPRTEAFKKMVQGKRMPPTFAPDTPPHIAIKSALETTGKWKEHRKKLGTVLHDILEEEKRNIHNDTLNTDIAKHSLLLAAEIPDKSAPLLDKGLFDFSRVLIKEDTDKQHTEYISSLALNALSKREYGFEVTEWWYGLIKQNRFPDMFLTCTVGFMRCLSLHNSDIRQPINTVEDTLSILHQFGTDKKDRFYIFSHFFHTFLTTYYRLEPDEIIDILRMVFSQFNLDPGVYTFMEKIQNRTDIALAC